MRLTETLLLNANAMHIPLKDKSVDMVLTSPPYGNLRDYNGYDFVFEDMAKEIVRVPKRWWRSCVGSWRYIR